MKQTGFHKVTLMAFGILFHSGFVVSQVINYTESNLSVAFVNNPAPIIEPTCPPGIDDALSNPINIGFTFQYGCIAYTQFILSSNGWMTFNLGCIGSDPNNQLAGNATQIANSERPIIAPMWDDLDIDATGNVNYQLTGVLPNRILTIEWKRIRWRFSALGACITFQVKLYETSNRIEFCYKQEATAANLPSASIGLTGAANGNYYSLTNTGAAPGVNFNAGEVTTLAAKPATNQVYRWDPVCPLPIELISFTGEKKGKNNYLKWTTASEMNNEYFSLEKSGDGISFIEIKKIKGAGNSNSIKNYEIIDLPNSSGTNYYRLKQTDFNRSYNYSNVIAIDNNLKENNFNVYPNPSAAEFSLQISEVSSVTVYSYEGKIIETFFDVNENFSFGKDYSAGIYFVKACGDQNNFSIKIIKE